MLAIIETDKDQIPNYAKNITIMENLCDEMKLEAFMKGMDAKTLE